MKRIVFTVLAIFYLGISSGATVHFHYCMGELASWGLEKETDNVCDFCGMSKSGDKTNDCCEDVEKQPKVEKSQKASQIVYQFDQVSIAVLPPQIYAFIPAAIAFISNKQALSNAPPDGSQVPVYLKNCTYRI